MSTKQSNGRRSSLASLWRGNNVFIINLVCPDNSTLLKIHPVRDTVRDVINNSCKSLEIDRTEIFGIAVYEHNEYRFISPKKLLQKFLLNATIVTAEQANKLDITDKHLGCGSTIKSCRLYLRVRHFYRDVDSLQGKTLNYYYEQVRLDTLKHQNWLNIPGFNDVFNNIAARSLWVQFGFEAVDILRNKIKKLHYFLPQCEQHLHTKEKLVGLLKDITGISEIEEEVILDASQIIDIPNIRVDHLEENEFKEHLMLTALNYALTLPFYGMYFYHVEYIQEYNYRLPNCKLGIGPFGLSITLSSDYTTWGESNTMKWSSVTDTTCEKETLSIHEYIVALCSTKVHRFVCVNEVECKYLSKQLKESQMFQLKNLEKVKSNNPLEKLRPKKRRNSIGVLSCELTNLALCSMMPRSTSMSGLQGSHLRATSISGLDNTSSKMSLHRTKSN